MPPSNTYSAAARWLRQSWFPAFSPEELPSRQRLLPDRRRKHPVVAILWFSRRPASETRLEEVLKLVWTRRPAGSTGVGLKFCAPPEVREPRR